MHPKQTTQPFMGVDLRPEAGHQNYSDRSREKREVWITGSSGGPCVARQRETRRNERSSGFIHTLQLSPKSSEYGLKNLRQRTGPIDIPEAMLTAPFLQYPALTPGQKRYLHSVCEAYSETHMRKLMQQHYLNILQRSIRIGNFKSNIIKPLRTSLPDLDHTSTQQKESSDEKAKDQKDRCTSKKMTILPKTNKQQQK